MRNIPRAGQRWVSEDGRRVRIHSTRGSKVFVTLPYENATCQYEAPLEHVLREWRFVAEIVR